MTAEQVIAADLADQGAAYPNAGASCILSALERAGYVVVELPPRDGPDDDGQEWFDDGEIRVDHTAFGTEHPCIYVGERPTTPKTVLIRAGHSLAAATAAEGLR